MDNYNVIQFSPYEEEKYTPLSNFYSPKQGFLIDKQIWPSIEHYFQAMKFSGDNMDTDVAREYIQIIKNAKTPAIATLLGETKGTGANAKFKGKLFVRPDWEQFKFLVMLNALIAKFTQNKKLFTLLTDVPNNTLFVEHTSTDKIWGDGGDGGDDTIGKNILGKMLTSISFALKVGDCSEMNNKLKAKIDIRPDFFGLNLIRKSQVDLSAKEVKTLEKYMTECFDINFKIDRNDDYEYCWYLVYKESELAGFIAVDSNNIIWNVCTNQHYRGIGSATMAINNAISIICRKKNPILLVDSYGVHKDKLLKFYGNLGFEKIGETKDGRSIIMKYFCNGKPTQQASTVDRTIEHQITEYIKRIYRLDIDIIDIPCFEINDENFTGGALFKYCVDLVMKAKGILTPADSDDDRIGLLKLSSQNSVYYFIVRVFTEFGRHLTIDIKLPSDYIEPCLDLQFHYDIKGSTKQSYIATHSHLNGIMYSADDVSKSCAVMPLPKDNLVQHLMSIFDYFTIDLGFTIASVDDSSDIRSLRGVCGTEETKWGSLPISISARNYLMMLRGYSYYNKRGFLPTGDGDNVDKNIRQANSILKIVKRWSLTNKSIVPQKIEQSSECKRYFNAEKKFETFYESLIKKTLDRKRPSYTKYYRYPKIKQGVYTPTNEINIEVTTLVDSEYPKFEFKPL